MFKLFSPTTKLNLGGYKEVHDPAITIKFKTDGEDDTYFLAWTTTPWTLPSNLALAVHNDVEYVKSCRQRRKNI